LSGRRVAIGARTTDVADSLQGFPDSLNFGA
jgi:hypothetical protein